MERKRSKGIGTYDINILTLTNCIYCNWLKGKLSELGIKYRETIIDNGSEFNTELGNLMEYKYKTENYPIVLLNLIPEYELITFISKTDLESQKGICIFDTIDDLIIKIQENL